ncbi:MAG TPA: hypothetical protein VFU28_10060 [Vicinamibacterales bacterium]|nr:hypothetical protein [Vicinamibacterales bacterium]
MTIKRAAAVLLLVTLAAAPVTSVVCIGWCFPAGAPTTTACHHASATTLGIKDADENCDRVLASSPFVKEETQQIAQAVLPANTPLSAFMSAVGAALLAYGHDVDPASSRRATSPLVLRL